MDGRSAIETQGRQRSRQLQGAARQGRRLARLHDARGSPAYRPDGPREALAGLRLRLISMRHARPAMRITLTRRKFIKWSAAGALAMPGLSRAADRPLLSHGVQSGDIEATRAWSGRGATVRRAFILRWRPPRVSRMRAASLRSRRS